MPGRPMPARGPATCCISAACCSSSTRLALAWASTIRSASISLSPGCIRLSSICTDTSSPEPLRITFTASPPEAPSTVVSAMRAWASASLDCMAWACFIREPRSFIGGVLLVLLFGHAHDQAVQRIGHLDLARQARIGLHVLGEVEHRLLHGRGLARLRQPGVVDIDMAGGAGAGAAAVGVDARHIVLDRAFHDRQAGAHIDRMFGPVELDVGDLGHFSLRATA